MSQHARCVPTFELLPGQDVERKNPKRDHVQCFMQQKTLSATASKDVRNCQLVVTLDPTSSDHQLSNIFWGHVTSLSRGHMQLQKTEKQSDTL